MTRWTSIAARSALALIAAVAILGACSSPSSEPADVVRTDSAGVRIVSSGAEDRDLPWRFDSVDVLRDSAGDPFIFTAIQRHRVLVDRAGRTYVLTHDPSFVRFGLDGKFDRTIGRKGTGPGEFQFPIAIASQGDTLVVKDGARRVLVRYSSSLDPVADRRLEGAFARVGIIEFRAGGFWFSQQFLDEREQGIELRADTVGGPPLHRIASPPGKPVKFTCIGMPYAQPLFSPTILWAAQGPRIIVNEQPDYALWLYEGSRAVASVRRPLTAREPTVDDVRALYPEGFEIRFGGERADCRVPIEELIARQGLAPSVPLVTDVQLLFDGTIWAQRTPAEAPVTVLDVFGPDGAYVGTTRALKMPVGRYPNGDLLVPRDDAESGGVLLMRVKIRR